MEKNDAAFTAFAYGTHADAYWNAGLGNLDLFDLAMIGLTPDIADLVPWSGISQAADIAVRLGDKWVTDAIDSTIGQGTTEQLRDLAEEGFSELGEGIDEVFGEGATETLIDGLEEIAEAVPEIYEEGQELIGEGISAAEELVGLPPGSVEDSADYLRENAQDGVNWIQDNVWSPLWE